MSKHHISHRDGNGEDVSRADYQATAATGRALEKLADRRLTSKADKAAPPLGRRVPGKWYDAEAN